MKGEGSQEDRMKSLQFLTDCWIAYNMHIEKNLNLDSKIVEFLKRSVRSHSFLMKIYSISLLFKLLEYLAMEKNPIAMTIYKTLTFFLIENHAENDVREFILRHFVTIFDKFPSIPVEILLEPFIK